MRAQQVIGVAEVLLILVFSCIPLFLSFPYRVNIYLSWEGSYRISQGQFPFRDFGMPLGYFFWVIPSLFMKLFGPQLITLVKAQAFINLVSGLSFRSILLGFRVPFPARILSIVFFLLTYSLVNFWPWYNHTVIVFELVALALLFRFLLNERKWYWLAGAGIFCFASFFTKQDAGALALMFCIILLLYDGYLEKDWKPVLLFLLSFAATAAIVILPLLKYEFTYWFNMGQEPHTNRFSVADFLLDLLRENALVKFSALLVIIVMMIQYHYDRQLFRNRQKVFFILLTLGMLVQAALLQVTSYTPPNNNVYFQSFVFAFMITQLSVSFPFIWQKPLTVVILLAFIILWRSDQYTGYLERLLETGEHRSVTASPSGENKVNRSNYLLNNSPKGIPEGEWRESPYPVFRKVRMPVPTTNGIARILDRPEIRKESPKVLNMSELTPLAVLVPFKLETGPDFPLWYHLGVGMFNREARMIEKKITGKFYDMVVFEHMPNLNNFYPFRVRDSLRHHYQKVDSFPAPRRGSDTTCIVEVYVR